MILTKLILIPLLVVFSHAVDSATNDAQEGVNNPTGGTIRQDNPPAGGAMKVLSKKQVKAIRKKVEKKNAEDCSSTTGLSAEEIQGCKAPKKSQSN